VPTQQGSRQQQWRFLRGRISPFQLAASVPAHPISPLQMAEQVYRHSNLRHSLSKQTPIVKSLQTDPEW